MSSINSKINPALTYFISFGLFSGRIHGKSMRQLLDKKGYHEIRNVVHADDIIIAHSAGCWLIPQTTKPKIVFYIGPALNNPNIRNWARSNRNNMRAFLNRQAFRAGARVVSINLLYGFIQPKRNINIVKTAKTAKLHSIKNAQIIFIANQDDPWPFHANLDALIEQQPWAFISLPGSHDNIWVDPTTYVTLVEYYAKQLLV